MSALRIVGGRDAAGRPTSVAVLDGRVVDDLPPDAETYDAAGAYVVPGLIDLQVNGAAGWDLTDEPERLWDVASALAGFGLTAFLPTVITSEAENRERALAALRSGPPDGWQGATPLGLHFEGPMLAAARKGAHPEHRLVPPSAELVAGWSRDAGVTMVTIAPELPGALEVIATLADRGVVVSIGHTEASTAETLAAVAAGATLVTHLGNAMPPIAARAAGPMGVALAGPALIAGVIADGVHLDPVTLRLAWQALAPDRFLAVTDTTAALGMPDGPARLGEQDVIVRDGVVRLVNGHSIAGSAASLSQILRTLVEQAGATLEDAVGACTRVPARVIADPTRGSLVVGSRADVTVLDDHLDPIATFVGGRRIGGP